ncbi:unnamed protein product [Symbiodinium microadriaticum]|nr:unnamed protein product [Symbiodinium microadriaticum]
MAARDIEQGQSPSHLADATPLHGEDQTAEGQELQLQHPEGVPVILGPPAIIAEGTRGVEPIPSQPCAFWSETAKLEHALRTHRPAHLDQDARRQASARPRAELVEQGAEASGVEDCGVPAGDVDEEQVDARLFEPPRTRQPQLEADRLILEQMRDLLAAVVTQQQEYSRRLERLEEEQAMRSVQARPQVHADPQQGMLRPTRGPEDVGVNYGQGSGAEGRPDDQRQGRDVYSPGDKTYWELPKLPELGPKQAPLQAGDWLTVITPMINDLAPAANEYWGSVLQAAECVYERWQSASPLLKAQVQANLPDHMRHARYSRLENRALSMLLRRTPGQVASAQDSMYDRTAFPEWPIVDKLSQIAGFRYGSGWFMIGGNFRNRPLDAQIPEDCLEYEPSMPSDDELDPESGKPGGIPVGITDHEGVPECDPESGRPGRMPVEVTDDEGMLERDDAGFLDKEAVDAVPKVCRVCQEEADDNTSYWKQLYATKVDGIGMRRLVFVETLPRRTKEEVSAALSRTLTKRQQWHFPVLRLHTDRGGKTSLLPPGDTHAALEDLAVVGGEVARVSEAGHEQIHEAPVATVVEAAADVADDGDLFPEFLAPLALRSIRGGNKGFTVEVSEGIARTMLDKHQVDTLEVASVVYASLCSTAKKGSRNIDSDVQGNALSWVISFGAYCRGSQVGLIVATRLRPMLLRLLNRLVASFDAAHEYTALRISFNAVADLHRDVHNQHGYRNMIVCLSEFTRGRVIAPDGPMEYSGGKAYIDPLVPHGVEPAVGPRLVVVAYTPGFATKLSVLDVHTLLSLGFNVPVPYRPIPFELKPSVRALQARVQDEAQRGGVRGTGDALEHPCAAVEPQQEIGEDIDPDLDVTTRTLMQLQVEAALEESGTKDVPISGEPAPDILLQTQQVSLTEVRQDLTAWKDAIAEELTALITVHQAVRLITKAELQELEASGVRVQVVPGKLVFSIKAPDRPYQPGIVKFIRSIIYRCQGRKSERHLCSSWDGVVIDVKTAFLLAPARRRDGSKIAVAVPRLIVDAGLLDPQTYLVVDRALYGLVESPADWSVYRDGTLAEWSWTGPGQSLRKLRRAEADPSIWFVLEAVEGESGCIEFRDEWGEILAILGVYVDDLLLTGATDELSLMIAAFGGLWKTSEPNWLKDGLRFCGVEVVRGSDGAYHLHQTSYLSDLVARYTLPVESSLPDVKTGYEEEETLSIPILRRAQKLVGLPIYSSDMDPLMNLGWSDASFGQDDGGRSHTGILLVIAGGAVSWHSSRQTLTALSTAESEIIAAVDNMVLARALAPLWAEMCRQDLRWSQCIDNSACIQLLIIPGGAWRTRHLRLRARHFHEAISDEVLVVQQLPGVEMLADCLTKAMPESRLFFLLDLIGYVWGESADASHDEATQVQYESSYVYAAPATADPSLAMLVAALAIASQVVQVQGARAQDDDNDDSLWALSESEVLFAVALIVAWEVAKFVALKGIKGGAGVLGWFRARLRASRSLTGSYQPNVQTVETRQHQVQSYRSAASQRIEQERLYGKQLFGCSFGWVDGWVDPGPSDRWLYDEASHVLVRDRELVQGLESLQLVLSVQATRAAHLALRFGAWMERLHQAIRLAITFTANSERSGTGPDDDYDYPLAGDLAGSPRLGQPHGTLPENFLDYKHHVDSSYRLLPLPPVPEEVRADTIPVPDLVKSMDAIHVLSYGETQKTDFPPENASTTATWVETMPADAFTKEMKCEQIGILMGSGVLRIDCCQQSKRKGFWSNGFARQGMIPELIDESATSGRRAATILARWSKNGGERRAALVGAVWQAPLALLSTKLMCGPPTWDLDGRQLRALAEV